MLMCTKWLVLIWYDICDIIECVQALKGRKTIAMGATRRTKKIDIRPFIELYL